jgi:hypothetical protein
LNENKPEEQAKNADDQGIEDQIPVHKVSTPVRKSVITVALPV